MDITNRIENVKIMNVTLLFDECKGDCFVYIFSIISIIRFFVEYFARSGARDAFENKKSNSMIKKQKTI